MTLYYTVWLLLATAIAAVLTVTILMRWVI